MRNRSNAHLLSSGMVVTMLFRVSIALLIVLASCQAEAAALKGVVLLDGADGPGVVKVRVSGVDGANRTETDPDGRFTLEFPKKQVGESVRFIVSKENYEVVNDVQLEQLLPASAGAKPLIVIMCRKGNREEMARRFYRLRSFDAIEETYRRRLQGLEGTKRATAVELDKLLRERDQAKDAAAGAAKELAKDQPGKTSELCREAMRYFLDGNIEQAVRILDDEQLRRISSGAKERKVQAEKAIAEVTQAWMTKGRFLTLQFRFDEAEQAYRAAIEASSDSFEANFALGVFSQELNHDDTAKQVFNRCLDLAKRSGNEPQIAATLNSLGNLYSDQNRMEEARRAYEEALKIRRELARKNPDTYLPDLAGTLVNLARIQNRLDEARKALEEALKIFRELARKNPDTYLPDVATTLKDLGLLDRDQNRMEEARQAYEEALKIRRELARKNPDTYLPDVAETLDSLGILHRSQTWMEEARQAFEEALKIRRELARKNPDTYLPGVAMTLVNLGFLHSNQNRMDEAREAYEEALKSYRDLARKNPDTYLPDVAMMLNYLGNLHRRQKRMDEARQAHEEALKICRDLAGKNPDTFLRDVATTLNNLGVLYSDQNRTDEARLAFEESLGIYERLAARDPERFRADVTRLERLLKALPR